MKDGDKSKLIAALKTQNASHLAAFNEGYDKGFNDACERAMELLNKPKRSYKKSEKQAEE